MKIILEKNWLNENLLHFSIPDKFLRLAEGYYEADILYRKLCLLGPNNPYEIEYANRIIAIIRRAKPILWSREFNPQ
mgnify:CR=1 FL=1